MYTCFGARTLKKRCMIHFLKVRSESRPRFAFSLYLTNPFVEGVYPLVSFPLSYK